LNIHMSERSTLQARRNTVISLIDGAEHIHMTSGT